jgi:hypothetical protein
VVGLAHDYKNFSQWLDQNLKPERTAQYRQAERSCINGYENLTNADMGSFFKGGYDVVFQDLPSSVMRFSGKKTVSTLVDNYSP